MIWVGASLNAMKAGIAAARASVRVLITMADGSDEYATVIEWSFSHARGRPRGRQAATCAAGNSSMDRDLKRLLSRTAGLTLYWFAGVPIHDATTTSSSTAGASSTRRRSRAKPGSSWHSSFP